MHSKYSRNSKSSNVRRTYVAKRTPTGGRAIQPVINAPSARQDPFAQLAEKARAMMSGAGGIAGGVRAARSPTTRSAVGGHSPPFCGGVGERSRAAASSPTELEYRLSSRECTSGISRDLFRKLSFMNIDHMDATYVTSESVVYIDKNNMRYMFVDNGERMSVMMQQKTRIDYVNGPPNVEPQYRLTLSQENTIDKLNARREISAETLRADLRSAHKYIVEFEGARHAAHTSCLVFGVSDDIETAVAALNIPSVKYIDYAVNIRDKNDKKKACGIEYICIESLFTQHFHMVADVIIDNNFILNYCNKEDQYLHRVFSWIYSALPVNGCFVCARFASDIDAYKIVSEVYPSRRLQYSKLYIDDYMLKLFMYRYCALHSAGCRGNSVRVDYFKKCERAAFVRGLYNDKDLYFRHKKTSIFVKDYYTIELSRVYQSDTLERCAMMQLPKTPILYEAELEFIDIPDAAHVRKPIEFITQYLGAPNNTNAAAAYRPIVLAAIRKDNKPINLTRRNVPNLNQYAVTNKTNGVRYYLILMNNQICLVNDKSCAHLTGVPAAACARTSHGGSCADLLDGELVNNVFHVFDCIINDGCNIGARPLEHRLGRARAFITQYQQYCTSFTMQLKEYHCRGDVYKRIVNAFELVNRQCAIENDGLIFTSLGAYSQPIYKYKYDIECLTIDFYIDQAFVGHVYTNDAAKFEPFVYTDQFGKQLTVKVKSQFSDPNCVCNHVCECRYNIVDDQFEVVRIRYDKVRPNHVSVAQSIWRELVEDSIPPAELLELVAGDRSHAALRFYNNGVKRGLITKYARGAVLDLGSGIGGDASKYLSTIAVRELVMCEPDVSKLDELARRVTQANARAIPTNINQLKAQNVDLCTRFDTVGAFFMLSFMYESEATLDAFVKTVDKHLNSDGYFIGTMMDGLPDLNTDGATNTEDISVYVIDKLTPGTAFEFGRRLKIRFKDCLDQIEFVSSFDVLRRKLSACGIHLVESARFSAREYLTEQENALTRANRYFVFKKSKNELPAPVDMEATIAAVSLEDIKPIMMDMVLKYADNLGLDSYTARRIREGKYRLYQLRDIPTINMHELNRAVLSAYRDRLRNDPMFLMWHWCAVNCKNARVRSAHNLDEIKQTICICSVYQWIDLLLA